MTAASSRITAAPRCGGCCERLVPSPQPSPRRAWRGRDPSRQRWEGEGQVSAWPYAFRLAARELRGGVRGFRIFLACLVLGVATIAGIGSLGAAVGSAI